MPTDQTSPSTTDAINGQRRHLLLLVGMFFLIFAGAGAQQLYLVPYLRQVTSWTGLECALLLAVVYATMMVFRVGNVYLLRRWPDWKWTLVGALTYFLFPIGMFLLAYLPSYALALAFAVLWGWGAATMWGGTTMQTLALTEGARSRHGLGMGLLYGGSHAGWFTGVIVLGLVFAHCGDRPELLYVTAAAITLLALPLALALPRSTDVTIASSSRAMLWEIVTRPKALIAMFLLGSSALAFGLMLGAFADYVRAEYGVGYIWITAMFFPGVRIVLAFLSGVLSDLGGRASVLSISFLLAAAGCAVAVVWHSPAALALTAALLGLLDGAVPVVSASLIGDSAERKRRPLAYGAIFTARDFGAVLGLILSRVVGGEAADLGTSFVIFAGLFLVCATVSALLQRYARQQL